MSLSAPPTLMIHSMRPEFFDLDLGSYRLSFDDGLYSQYYYFPRLEAMGTEKLFFVTTSLIAPGPARGMFDGRHLPYIKSPRYMREAALGSGSALFMTSGEVAFLKGRPNVRIGAHSHFHDVTLTDFLPKKPNSLWKRERLRGCPDPATRALAIRSRLAYRGCACRRGRLVRRTPGEWLDFVRRDTERCLEWFRAHLGFQPTLYCLPFNEYSAPLLEVLRTFGFSEFFGGRGDKNGVVTPRRDIETLWEATRSRHV